MEKRSGYEQRERDHFDRLAETIGETSSDRKTHAAALRMERRAEMLKDALRGFRDPRVLEIGAGAGAFTEFVLGEMPGLDLTACDLSPKCVELARARIGSRWPQVKFQVANVVSLEFADASFDCVCGCSILHHLPLRPALVELYRVLKPGGVLWFSEPNMLNPQIAIQKNVRVVGKWLDDTEDETAYFRWPLARELTAVGFTSARVRPFDFLHPGTPAGLLGVVGIVAKVAESIPMIRELAGSLVIEATRPA